MNRPHQVQRRIQIPEIFHCVLNEPCWMVKSGRTDKTGGVTVGFGIGRIKKLENIGHEVEDAYYNYLYRRDILRSSEL